MIHCSCYRLHKILMILSLWPPFSCKMYFSQIIHFSTHVRSRETRSIVLNNRTNLMWHLTPKIDGAYWTGADLVTVEPLQSKNYELVYRPLVMTGEGKRHQVRYAILKVIYQSKNQRCRFDICIAANLTPIAIMHNICECHEKF